MIERDPLSKWQIAVPSVSKASFQSVMQQLPNAMQQSPSGMPHWPVS